MFGDSSDDMTRRHRRSLLIMSTICIIIAQTNIIPTKFETLGITIEEVDHPALVQISQGVIYYLLISFIIDGTLEFANKESNVIKSLSQTIFLSPMKIFLDLIFPVLLSLVAIVSLIDRCIEIEPGTATEADCSFLPFAWIDPILNLVRPFSHFGLN